MNTHTHISKISFLCILFLALCILTGCKKEYINGDLDGLWKIENITVNGEDHTPSEPLFWAFSFHVVQLTEYGGPVSIGNLGFNGSVISVDFPYEVTEEDALALQSWGVYENPASYTVESLTSSRLTMTQGKVTVKLHKY